MRKPLVLIGAAVIALAACSSSSKKVETAGSPAACTSGTTATIDTNMGQIVVALHKDKAPKAAGRFIELACKGFYNGLTFHRVVPDFVIQGGDPKGDGTGGSGTQPVVGETPTDGYPIGSLAAAKTGADPPGT